MAKPGKPKPTSKALRSSKAGDLRRSRKPSPVAGKRKTASKTGNGRALFGGLRPNAANFAPLTPVSFLPRSADIHPDRAAVIHGTRRWTYRQLYQRSRQLASALAAAGVQPGDTVSVVLPNVPAMIEAHHGVPMLGAVLNTINTRLQPATIAYILAHGEAKVLITDREFAAQVGPGSGEAEETPARHRRGRCALPGPGERLGKIEYEDFIATGDPSFAWTPPADESSAIALNYTSGTTGNPKGVVYHHRGTFLEAVGHVMAWPLPPKPVYLWTLPMFHCNGWGFPWSVVAMGGTHVCLRKVDPALIFPMIVEHGVTHMCGAPTVLSLLTSAPAEQRRSFHHVVDIQTGGSPPPAKVIKGMEDSAFASPTSTA